MFDTSNWKEFRMSNIFDIEHVKKFSLPNKPYVMDGDIISSDGINPYIAAISTNNGIKGYSKYAVNNEGDCITLSTTADSSNTVFYQKNAFIGRQQIAGIRRKDGTMGEHCGLFIVSVLKPLLRLFNYGNKLTIDYLRDLYITLPATPSGEPDWNFMEQYIAELEEERVAELEAYLVSTGLDDYELTEEDREVLDVSPKWGKFRIGDLFEKKTVKGFPKKIAPNIYDFVSTNGFPVYGQNIKRQYDCLVELPDEYLYEVTTPILAYTSSVGEIGMVEESFYRSGDNGAFQALIPLFDANTYNIRYMLAILRKIFANFEYGTSMQNIKELKFKLPVLHDGTPDFEYMEKYIRTIEKLTIKGVVEWNAKELKQ